MPAPQTQGHLKPSPEELVAGLSSSLESTEMGILSTPRARGDARAVHGGKGGPHFCPRPDSWPAVSTELGGPQARLLTASPWVMTENRCWGVTAVIPSWGQNEKAETNGPEKDSCPSAADEWHCGLKLAPTDTTCLSLATGPSWMSQLKLRQPWRIVFWVPEGYPGIPPVYRSREHDDGVKGLSWVSTPPPGVQRALLWSGASRGVCSPCLHHLGPAGLGRHPAQLQEPPLP